MSYNLRIMTNLAGYPTVFHHIVSKQMQRFLGTGV